MKLSTINTGFFKLDGGAMFGVVPKSLWQKINPADENNMCNWAMRCLLIQTGNRNILIDTGIGNKQSDKFFGYYYLNGTDSLANSLNSLNLDLSDISDVILTHLHFDHVGGAVSWNDDRSSYIPTFPNATYHVSEKHWHHALNPNPRERPSFLQENFVPLQENGRINFVRKDEEVYSGVICRMVNGHTAEMICPEITFDGKTLFYGADLYPSSGHVALNYIMAYDIEPLKSMEEKKYWNERLSQPGCRIFFEHDKEVECAEVIKNDKGQYVLGTHSDLKDWI